MKNRYKLLYFEDKNFQDEECYRNETILKGSSDWIELTEQEAHYVSLYLKEKYGYCYTQKYILIKDATFELEQMIKEGIVVGKKLNEKNNKKK